MQHQLGAGTVAAGDFAHVRDETVTAFRNGLDVLDFAGSVLENPAEDGNIPCKATFLYEAVRPNQLNQLVLFDDAPAVGYEC